MQDPFIISSLILAIAFLFLLIINHKFKSKVIKISFLVLSLIFLILIATFDNKYILEFLKLMITYLWYPNYLMFTSTVFLSILILIKTLLTKKIFLIKNIFNYLFFVCCFACYIIHTRLDIKLDLYSSLYSTPALITRRIVSIFFLIWLILTIIFKLMKRGQNAK